MKSTQIGVEILTKKERERRETRRADRQRQDMQNDPKIRRPVPAADVPNAGAGLRI